MNRVLILLSKRVHLNHNNGLLNDIIDLGLDEVKECAHTALRRLLNFDGTATDSTDRLPNEVHVHLRGISEIENSS